MYWNNPIEHIVYPSDSDILFKATHHGQHCLYYDPAVDITHIHNDQTLNDLCDLINQLLQKQDIDHWLSDPGVANRLANIVKVNIWINDLSTRGNIKPLLLVYDGSPLYNFNGISGTGSSRLKVLERVPTITHVAGFITTNITYQSKFEKLELITTFDRFAELCQAVPGQKFLFRLTDDQADYGVDWYEYDSRRTANVTLSDPMCISALRKYLSRYPDTIFTPEWFDQLRVWDFSE